jgi:HAD superfamily hydrolase (TIGR01509 family)
MKLRLKAVIFDMDGVITDTMPYHFTAWVNALSSIGIRLDCYDVYRREGQDGVTTLKEILKRHRLRLGIREINRVLNIKEKMFKRIVRVKFIAGSREFLKELKSRKIMLALVTGTSRHETMKMLPYSLYKLFDVIITANDVLKSKPHPEPFFKAIKLLGVSKKDAVVIENAPFGIKAAKKAGIFCIALETSLPRRFLKEASLIFKSIKELRKEVKIIKI